MRQRRTPDTYLKKRRHGIYFVHRVQLEGRLIALDLVLELSVWPYNTEPTVRIIQRSPTYLSYTCVLSRHLTMQALCQINRLVTAL